MNPRPHGGDGAARLGEVEQGALLALYSDAQARGEALAAQRGEQPGIVAVGRQLPAAVARPLLCPAQAGVDAAAGPLAHLAPHHRLHVRFDPTVGDRRGGRALARRRALQAVIDHPFALGAAFIGLRRQQPSTAPATQQAVQQRGVRSSRSRAAAHRRLGGLPCRGIDQRLMRRAVHEPSVAHLAEIDPPPQQAAHGRRCPTRCPEIGRDAPRGQIAGQARRALPLGAAAKQVTHQRSKLGIEDQPAVASAAIAERDRPHVHPAIDGLLLSAGPHSAHPVKLPLGQAEHQAQDEPSGIGVEVQPISDRDHVSTAPGDPLDGREPVDQRTSEAIELGHAQDLGVAALLARDRLHQQRPVGSRARLIQLLEDLTETMAVQPSPPLDLLSLHDRGDEAFAPSISHPTHPDVSVDDHAPSSQWGGDRAHRRDAGPSPDIGSTVPLPRLRVSGGGPQGSGGRRAGRRRPAQGPGRAWRSPPNSPCPDRDPIRSALAELQSAR